MAGNYLRQLVSQVESAQRAAEAAGHGSAELVARMNGQVSHGENVLFLQNWLFVWWETLFPVKMIIVQAEAVESLESELETAKDRLRKNVEAVDGINKSILVFESRHVETVERMKEVGGFNDGSTSFPPILENLPTK